MISSSTASAALAGFDPLFLTVARAALAGMLALALPMMLALCWLNAPATLAHVPGGAWAGLAYVAVFSMLVGFVFWYRGLALGGIAAVGQLQLLQPGLGLAASALVLHETVPPVMAVATIAIVLCVAGARRFV